MGHNLAILAVGRFMGSDTGWGDLDPDVVRKAIRDEGVAVIKAVVSDKEVMRAFWSAGIEAAQDHAQRKAGAWLFDGVGVVFKRVTLWTAICAVIYFTGGWSALKAWLAFK